MGGPELQALVLQISSPWPSNVRPRSNLHTPNGTLQGLSGHISFNLHPILKVKSQKPSKVKQFAQGEKADPLYTSD